MKEDFNKLRLKYHGDPVMLDDILQRECRYKTASKLSETLRNPNFRFPSLAIAEMSTSDAVAEVHCTMIPENSHILDMTCGLGIDSFHFASKAAEVTCVELDKKACHTAIKNAEVLGLNNVKFIEGDSITYLEQTDQVYDIIFADPARRDSAGRHFALRDCSPNLIPALSLILSRCSRLIVKASPMIDINAAVREIGYDTKVTVIGTPKECKEVVFSIDADKPLTENPEITFIAAITIGGSPFEFNPQKENAAIPEYGSPTAGEYLYEPYPSVMKAGGMRIIADRFHVAKLHPNTHLFTSQKCLDSFPGERFEIIEVLPFSKQTIKTISKNYPIINIATRNFPLTAPQLTAKLKTKDGGDRMLFGCMDSKGSKLLVITSMGTPL